MVIKAIVFDVGEVVLNESGAKARDILCSKFGIDKDKFKEFVIKNIFLSYTGRLKGEKFFEKLSRELNLNVDKFVLEKEWARAREKTSFWIKGSKEIIKKLSKKYIVWSLTNSTFLNDSVEIRKDAYRLFKRNIVSCEVGLMKPDPLLYNLLLKELKKEGIKPSETLFIDDKEENLIPAKNLGINTILFNNKINIANKIKEFGVKW